jgi:hypothetical protein
VEGLEGRGAGVGLANEEVAVRGARVGGEVGVGRVGEGVRVGRVGEGVKRRRGGWAEAKTSASVEGPQKR